MKTQFTIRNVKKKTGTIQRKTVDYREFSQKKNHITGIFRKNSFTIGILRENHLTIGNPQKKSGNFQQTTVDNRAFQKKTYSDNFRE